MNKNVLITGSSGFIGRNLKEQLKEKYNLFTPSHLKLELTDFKEVKKYFQHNQIDVVDRKSVV